MTGHSRTYIMPCCGRVSLHPPPGPVCFDCELQRTSPQDPIAVAYRARLARYQQEAADAAVHKL